MWPGYLRHGLQLVCGVSEGTEQPLADASKRVRPFQNSLGQAEDPMVSLYASEILWIATCIGICN